MKNKLDTPGPLDYDAKTVKTSRFSNFGLGSAEYSRPDIRHHPGYSNPGPLDYTI